MTADDMIDMLKGLNMTEITGQAIDDTDETMLALNRDQLKQGIRADGERIKYLKGSHYPYSKGHERYRMKLGLQVEVVDLFIRGDFYRSEFIEHRGDEIEFSSSIKLGEYLEEMYGTKVLGLTDKNTENYSLGDFHQALINRVEERTGLKFN